MAAEVISTKCLLLAFVFLAAHLGICMAASTSDQVRGSAGQFASDKDSAIYDTLRRYRSQNERLAKANEDFATLLGESKSQLKKADDDLLKEKDSPSSSGSSSG